MNNASGFLDFLNKGLTAANTISTSIGNFVLQREKLNLDKARLRAEIKALEGSKNKTVPVAQIPVAQIPVVSDKKTNTPLIIGSVAAVVAIIGGVYLVKGS